MRKWVISLVILCILIFLLSVYDLKSLDIKGLKVLWGNLVFLSLIVLRTLPLLLLTLILFFILSKKWAFRVERLSIGGFNILFDNPNVLFKRQIRTFLDTKRTLFKVDFDHDNFDETLTSYFETYGVIREEIKILGNAKKAKKLGHNNPTLQLYDLANQMIRELNHFLTESQTNYRRWYKFMEMNHKEDFYLEPIGKLQKKYPNYDDLCAGFKNVNVFFRDKVVEVFQIDIEKWGY